MGSYEEHQILIKRFKVAIQDELDGVRLFDRVGGLLYTKNGTPVKVGTNGMADCYGMYPSKYGLILLEFEMKTGRARQSISQKRWQQFIESRGGFYIVVREDYSDAIDKVKEYLNEKKSML